MEKVDADCYTGVVCICPHCGAVEYILYDYRVRESMGDDHRSEGCDIEIVCPKCGAAFIVENIDF